MNCPYLFFANFARRASKTRDILPTSAISFILATRTDFMGLKIDRTDEQKEQK
jgi:hypothetical protein